MKAFFESSAQVDGKPQVAIYNARWEDVWPTLGLSPKDVALCWADPPYGVKERTDRMSKGRGMSQGAISRTPLQGGVAYSRDWKPVHGDRQPFSPAPLLMFERVVLWGGNHYANALPPSPSWLVWDKRDGSASNDNADAELAWTTMDTRRPNAGGATDRESRPGGPVRVFRHLWNGVCTASEAGNVRLHPTQKPVALSEWAFAMGCLKPGDLVFAPYLGSGPEVRAALNLGLRIIGCEVDADYCRTVVDHRVALAAPRRGQEGQRLLFGDAS